MMFQSKRAMSVTTMVEMLDVDHQTVMQWIKTGQLNAFNVTAKRNPGRPTYRVLEVELATFIEHHIWTPMPGEPVRAVPRCSGRVNHTRP
jgi:hypothetical protein